MKSAIHNMTIIRYYRDGRPWDKVTIENPSFSDVENAILQMDNYCFPIVELRTFESEENEDEETFTIMGGDGRFTLFELFGKWHYVNPNGSNEEVWLWASDQGYKCEEKNIIYEIEKVMKIVKIFYETGSYENLDD